jgi:hypothetical protein
MKKLRIVIASIFFATTLVFTNVDIVKADTSNGGPQETSKSKRAADIIMMMRLISMLL